MKKRIYLLLGYWIVALVVSYTFSGYGDLSLVPFAILVSWSGFVSKLISQLLKLREEGLLFEGFIIALSLFVLYYIGLFRFVSRLSAGKKASTYFIPSIIHFSGGLTFMIMLDKQATLPPGILDSEAVDWGRASWYIASYIVSLVITLLWLSFDWRLAKKGRVN